MSRGSPSLRLLLALALLGAATAYGAWATSTSRGIDFYQFWAIGQALAEPGATSIYAAPARERIGELSYRRSQRPAASPRERAAGAARRRLEPFSSPLLYALFGMAASGRYDVDYARYQIVCWLAGLLGILALSRLVGLGWAAALVVASLLSLSDPFLVDAVTGNVNRILLFVVATYLLLQRSTRAGWQDVLAAAWLAFWSLFKPSVALVVGTRFLALSIGRRWRRLGLHGAGTAGGVVLAIAVSASLSGSLRGWLDWILALRGLTAAEARAGLVSPTRGNFSLAGFVRDTTGWNPGPIILAAFVVATAAALLLRRRRLGPAALGPGARVDPAQEVRLAGIGLAVVLLAAPLAWTHYFVLVTPLGIALFQPLRGSPRLRMRATSLGLAALALAAFAGSNLVSLYRAAPAGIAGLGRWLYPAATLALALHALWRIAVPAPGRSTGPSEPG